MLEPYCIYTLGDSLVFSFTKLVFVTLIKGVMLNPACAQVRHITRWSTILVDYLLCKFPISSIIHNHFELNIVGLDLSFVLQQFLSDITL